MVVFRDMICNNRALIFTEIGAKEIPQDEKTNAHKANDPRTEYELKCHLFVVHFIEVKKTHECRNFNNYKMFNCHTIRPRHWRLLTRIDTQ